MKVGNVARMNKGNFTIIINNKISVVILDHGNESRRFSKAHDVSR